VRGDSLLRWRGHCIHVTGRDEGMADLQLGSIAGFVVRVLRSRKARSVFAGNGVGQLIALAMVPVIARLFDPAAVGEFGLFSSVVVALAVVSCLALDQAIPVAEDQREAHALQVASAVVLVGFVGVVSLVLMVALPLGASRLEGLGPHLVLVPLAVLLAGLVQIGIQAATQRQDFGALARGFAVRTGGTAIAQVAVALVVRDGTGMILAQMLALACAVVVLGGAFRGALPSRSALRAAVLRHKYNPLYLAPRLVVGSAGDVAVLLLLSAWFETSEVGFYWMAGRLLQVPSGFIDPPTRQLFMSAAMEARARTGRFGSVLIASAGGLMAIACLVMLVLVLFGHPLIQAVLGPGWDRAVPFVQIIGIGWAFEFAAVPSSNAVLLLGLQRQHFLYDVALRLMVLAGLGVGCWYNDLLLGCAMVAGVRVVMIGSFCTYLVSRSLNPSRAAVVSMPDSKVMGA
jgi:O-antigen/teichoic acid export membrane protein